MTEGRMCLNIDERLPYCINHMDLQDKSSWCNKERLSSGNSPRWCANRNLRKGQAYHGLCDYECNACASKDVYPTYSFYNGHDCTSDQLFSTGEIPPMVMAQQLCSKGGNGWTGVGLQTCMLGVVYFLLSSSGGRTACYKACEDVCDSGLECFSNSPAACEEGCDFARFGMHLCSDCSVDLDPSLCSAAVGSKYGNTDFNFLTMTGCALRKEMEHHECLARCQDLTWILRDLCTEGCLRYERKHGNCPAPAPVPAAMTSTTTISTIAQITSETISTTKDIMRETVDTLIEAKKTSSLVDPMGAAGCPCIGSLPSEIGVVDCSYDWAVDGKCLEKDSRAGNYGEQCGAHAEPDNPDCYTTGDSPKPRRFPEPWCGQKWCYVDPCNCDMSDATKSTYFGTEGLAYSYATCGGSNGYTETKFPDQNMVGNANSSRYDGDCGGPTDAPWITYRVEYDVQFTADIDKTGDWLMADISFIAGLKDAIAKGWGAAGSTVTSSSIEITDITLTDSSPTVYYYYYYSSPAQISYQNETEVNSTQLNSTNVTNPVRRLMGKLEPVVPRRLLNESGLVTSNIDLVAQLKKIAASSEYKARASEMKRIVARRLTKISERGVRRLASKSVQVEYNIIVPRETAVALNAKLQDAEFTESFAGAFSSELEAKTKVTPSAVMPSTTASTIFEYSSTTRSPKKAVADGTSLLTMSLGTVCLMAGAF